MAGFSRSTSAARRWTRSAVVGVALGLLFLLLVPAVALADHWSDISDAQWQSIYKISADDAYEVAQGYPDGSFRPNDPVTRGQFAKMAVQGLGIPTQNPPTPSFYDVPRGSTFYQFVEGAHTAGIIRGYSNGNFGPWDNLLRQQAYSILGKYLSAFEIEAYGAIKEGAGSYANLDQWYAAQGASYLSDYADANQIDAVHKPAAAYLVARGIVLGSQSGGQWYLQPLQTLNRAPAVALIVRTQSEVIELGTPAITSVAPQSGPAAGGTVVTVLGHGFIDVDQVKFGSVPATAFTVNSGISITVTAPASAIVGMVDISVVNSFGTSADTAADNFTYLAVPLITSLDPSSGPTSGGNQVIIHGVNFLNVSQVKFGDATASFTQDSSMQVTTVAPAHPAGDVTVQVTAAGGVSSPAVPAAVYTYGEEPTLTSLEPNAGPVAGENVVTLSGSHLTGASQVTFGGEAGDIQSVTDSAVTVEVPAQTGLPRDETVSVTVVTPLGTATLPDSYMYLLPPTLTGLEPDAGPLAGGQTVVISGYHLFHVESVVIGGEDASVVATSADGQSVTVTTPANDEGPAAVTVDTAGGTSTLFAAYDYVAVPTIDTVNPNSAPAGLPVDVTVTGTDFVDVTLVKFGDATATAVTTVSPNVLRVTVPAQVGGVLDVYVKAAGGEVTKQDAFTFTYTLSGAVTEDGTTTPVADVTVSVYLSSDMVTPVDSVSTAANGTYSFELPPGTYTVYAEKSGYLSEWYNDQTDPGDADPVTLNSNRSGIDFVLTPET